MDNDNPPNKSPEITFSATRRVERSYPAGSGLLPGG